MNNFSIYIEKFVYLTINKNNNMMWLLLIVSGIMETGCIISLKYTNGFSNKYAIIFYTVFGFISAYLLSISLKHIQLGLAFLVWMGVSATGVIIAEHILFSTTYNHYKTIFMLLILAGIVGLKFLEQ